MCDLSKKNICWLNPHLYSCKSAYTVMRVCLCFLVSFFLSVQLKHICELDSGSGSVTCFSQSEMHPQHLTTHPHPYNKIMWVWVEKKNLQSGALVNQISGKTTFVYLWVQILYSSCFWNPNSGFIFVFCFFFLSRFKWRSQKGSKAKGKWAS